MFSTLMPKVLAVALAAVVAALGVFILLWYLQGNELKKTVSALDEAMITLESNSKEITQLKLDSGIKAALNKELTLQISGLKTAQSTVLDDLSEKMTTLESKYPKANVTIDKVRYVEAAYIEQVTATVIDSMWESYCLKSTSPSCKVAVK